MMNEFKDLASYYITLKRIFYNNPKMRSIKTETVDGKNLLILETLLNDMNISYEEYIMYQVKYFKKFNRFPTTPQLISNKAISRFKESLRFSSREGTLYKADPSSVMIKNTGQWYHLDEFNKEMGSDMKILLIFTIIKEDRNISDYAEEKMKKVWECYHYLLAKYEYFKQTVPDKVLEWGKKWKMDETIRK